MTKKVPTQTEAVEQANQISANSNLSSNDKPAMLDPIAYREDVWNVDFDPKKLQNADINISQYWDDSSAENYNKQDLWGWENKKYSWAETKNSQVAYNKEATLEWLDPNYKYWQAAQMANSAEANYIARRNDEIASALYNAWKTSMEDVYNFLNSQEWFRNSVENERQNTVLSVWKRLGDIAKENQKNDDWQPQEDNSPNEALTNMENDLNKGTDWELYWKVTADDNWWDWIKTLEDSNSVYKAMNEARIRSFKDMQAMSSESIAASVVSWVMASDTQTMRDLMQYDPAKYQEVQNQIKALRWQMNINAIASWEWEWNTSATNWQWSLSNEKAEFISSYNWTNTNTADLLKSVNSSLSSNVAASSAQEQLTSIENDMSNLQNRMKNLKAEARSVFKWDVPQYIVNAYIANRRQEIQDQLSVLETRYNAAYSRYQNEWERTKWNAEFWLKQQELQLKIEAQWLERYLAKEGVKQKWFELDKKYPTKNPDWTTNVPITTVPREEIEQWVDALIQGCTDWTLGKAQCAAGIQKYYLPYLWVDLWSLSAWSAKQGICNEDRSYTPQKWDLIVMEWSKPEYWHIGIVTWVDENTWTIKYLDWNWEVKDWVGTETAGLRSIPISNNKVYGYYNPTKEPIQQTPYWYNPDVLEWHWDTYDLAWYYWWNDLSEAAKETVRWLLTYQIDPDSLPKTWENWVYKTQVLNAAAAIGRDAWWTDKKAKSAAKFVDKWNNALNQWWVGSANSTAASLLWELSSEFKEFNPTNIQTVNSIINKMAKEAWWTDVLATYTDLRVAASEVAKALKGNASATKEEIEDMKNLLTWKMSNEQAQEVFKHFARNLVDKNASEAQQYRRVVWYKPESIYLEEVSDWMNNELWVNMGRYYDYTPSVSNSYSIPNVWGWTDYSSQM